MLKAPSENFSDDAQYLEGFMREQWVASRINHSGVMKIFPRPAHSPFLYLLCEYIEGKTLRQWLFDNPKPALESVRTITRELVVGAACIAAHAHDAPRSEARKYHGDERWPRSS